MIQEYALEPSLLTSWAAFRFFISQFGFEHGRLLAPLPSKKHWKRLVRDQCKSCGEVEKLRIVEALNRLQQKMDKRNRDGWDPLLDWLQNAERLHASDPFHAIVAQSNPRQHPRVIVGDSIDDTVSCNSVQSANSLWKATRSAIVQRTPESMADAIHPILRDAQNIVLVDKYFGPDRPRHRRSFEEFMTRIRERAVAPHQVSVHCAFKPSFDFAKSCEQKIKKLIPTGLVVQFHRWQPEDLHNRFVLSEVGGAAFLEGLDVFGGEGRTEDVVVLLDSAVTASLLDCYTIGKSKYRLLHSLEIHGSG